MGHVDLYGQDKFSNILLAVIFISIYPSLYIAQITEIFLREEIGKDYIRTCYV